MRTIRSGARLRPLMPVAALIVAALAAVSGRSEPASGAPPSVPFAVPADVFEPVVFPTQTAIGGWNQAIQPRHLVDGRRRLIPGGAARPVQSTASPSPSPSPSPRDAAAAPSRHLWPLPVRGTITTRFSANHAGLDIAVRAGTPVRAIAGGTVTWAGWKTTGGGYVVQIRHPDGMVSRYNHNRRVLVEVGQIVAQGELIAEVGSTGWATGPHLDLRIEMGGLLVNPLGLRWSR